MIDRDKILEKHSLVSYLMNQGIELRGEGLSRTTNRCPEKEHGKTHFCVSVNVHQQIFHCHSCGTGGSIIDWMSVESGKSISDILQELGVENEESNELAPVKPFGNTTIVATYDYEDEQSNLMYQVVRYEPKTFRQRQPKGNGGWKWTMDGVIRILFNLKHVLTSKVVVVVEGEKDANKLNELGFVATCNVGGAGKWLDAYSDNLKGKEIIIIPDNDKPGKEHAKKIIESLTGKVVSLQVLTLPDSHKDVSDFIGSCSGAGKAKDLLEEIIKKTPHVLKPLPVYTIQEMEEQYIAHVNSLEERSFDLSKFLPKLRNNCRPLIPGELAVVMANTGVGKTAIMQTMARYSRPLPTLFFELELPLELMFERWVQMEVGCFGSDVTNEYKNNSSALWTAYKGLNHVLMCPESGISSSDIEEYIDRSELKFGKKPVVVFVDYIGLVKSHSVKSKYESVSMVAEDLKVIAKRTGTIIIVGTQVSRDKHAKTLEVGLYDAKDSGSIENSAGLVLGCWRPASDKLCIKVLKNTKGYSGNIIECDFDGSKMKIKQCGN